MSKLPELITACRVCSSHNLIPVVDLGLQPWANNFLTKEECGKEPTYPLRVVHCADCKTAQLDYTVPKEQMFGNHTYRSGITKTLADHFGQVSADLRAEFPDFNSVLDIGSNDGTQLQSYKDMGWNVLGVESSKPTAKYAMEHGIPTWNFFFNLETAQFIHEHYKDTAKILDQIENRKTADKYRSGKFDVINAAGVFYHLEELHSVCDGIKLLLEDRGVFVVQFIYAKGMMENMAFDQIYHEHLLYYNLTTIERLLNRHGLAMFDAYVSPIHGGSIIGYVGHTGYRNPTDELLKLRLKEEASGCNERQAWRAFGDRIEDAKKKNLDHLRKWKAEGKHVYGMGAPVKGNTLLNTFGIKSDLIECLTERNELRRNLYAPGSHIPVLMEAEVNPPDVYFCLAWNFKGEILARNAELIKNGVEFYFPVDILGLSEGMF